jgi:hypothetical protein
MKLDRDVWARWVSWIERLTFTWKSFRVTGNTVFAEGYVQTCLSGRAHCIRDLIQQDIEQLRQMTSKVEALVDREFAHLDRKHLSAAVTFNDLDAALDALNRRACKYICLLTGGYRDTLEATIQAPWKEIFTVPLRKPT